MLHLLVQLRMIVIDIFLFGIALGGVVCAITEWRKPIRVVGYLAVAGGLVALALAKW